MYLHIAMSNFAYEKSIWIIFWKDANKSIALKCIDHIICVDSVMWNTIGNKDNICGGIYRIINLYFVNENISETVEW